MRCAIGVACAGDVEVLPRLLGRWFAVAVALGATGCLSIAVTGTAASQTGGSNGGQGGGDSAGSGGQTADGTVGFTCPNGVCAHPRDDPQNCGACGNACPPGVACVAGACAGSICGIGHWGNFCGDAGERTCCPGADCTDTQTDSLNCGYCGSQCPPGTHCSVGACG